MIADDLVKLQNSSSQLREENRSIHIALNFLKAFYVAGTYLFT